MTNPNSKSLCLKISHLSTGLVIEWFYFVRNGHFCRRHKYYVCVWQKPCNFRLIDLCLCSIIKCNGQLGLLIFIFLISWRMILLPTFQCHFKLFPLSICTGFFQFSSLKYPVWTAGEKIQFKLGKKSNSSNSIFQTRELQKSSADR